VRNRVTLSRALVEPAVRGLIDDGPFAIARPRATTRRRANWVCAAARPARRSFGKKYT
jgi:hypothetical protein